MTNFRDSTKIQQPQNPTFKVLDNSIDIYTKLKSAVCSQKTQKSFGGVKAVSLTATQIERHWSALRVPNQLHLQLCPKCGHKSTNFPLENDEIETYNMQKADDYKKDV